MSKWQMLQQVDTKLCNVIITYTCSRNKDAGLVDSKIENRLNECLTLLREQKSKLQS